MFHWHLETSELCFSFPQNEYFTLLTFALESGPQVLTNSVYLLCAIHHFTRLGHVRWRKVPSSKRGLSLPSKMQWDKEKVDAFTVIEERLWQHEGA